MKLIHPPGMPPHPWLSHTWIFPEDHPLALLERKAKQQQLDKPPKQLEAGDDKAL